MHGHGMWLSSELLSPWDLAGQWNKVAATAYTTQPTLTPTSSLLQYAR